MLQPSGQRLILASASSSRRTLLEAAGLEFQTQPANIDESEIKRGALADGANAEQTALLLAQFKAARVARREPDALVIGADQILVCDGVWFDKPATVSEAREHLMALRGRTHELATAVLCQQGEQRVWHHVVTPRLTMRHFSDAFLDDYLLAAGDSVTSTVGAYRLESLGVHLFQRIDGEHAAILGLPMLALLGFLRQHRVLLE